MVDRFGAGFKSCCVVRFLNNSLGVNLYYFHPPPFEITHGQSRTTTRFFAVLYGSLSNVFLARRLSDAHARGALANYIRADAFGRRTAGRLRDLLVAAGCPSDLPSTGD